MAFVIFIVSLTLLMRPDISLSPAISLFYAHEFLKHALCLADEEIFLIVVKHTEQLYIMYYSLFLFTHPVQIQLHEAIDYLGDADCQRLARFTAERRWRDLKKLFHNYQSAEPRYMELLNYFRDLKVTREPVNRTEGRFYDLEAVFQTCNQRNFGGKMPRPKGLTWSQRVNHSTMGTYNLNDDTVPINRGLDRRDVPAYVLDFIMYHELLHKLLGVKTVGSRRHAHTPEFRKLEQAHPQYLQAQGFIKKNASRL